MEQLFGESVMENCRTFQIRFDKLSDGNVVTDILASNVRYERPIVSNKNVATTTEPPTLMIEGAVWRKNKIIFVRLTLPPR